VEESAPRMSELDRKWRARWSAVVKYGSYGALFAGGALLIAELVGPSIARDLGNAGGQAFGEGMQRARRWLDA
jgi:hypothetical protein